jgi:hypothetical protein
MEGCAPQEGQSVLTLDRTPGVLTALVAGLTKGDADGVFTLHSPSPLQAHAQGLTVENVSGPPPSRITDNQVSGSFRITEDQYRAGQAINLGTL